MPDPTDAAAGETSPAPEESGAAAGLSAAPAPAVTTAEGEVLPAPAGAVDAPAVLEAFRAHDFRQPAFLTAVELRRLKACQQEFARALSARLSIYLRIEFGLRVLDLRTVGYRKFTHSLPQPTCVTLFKVEPLRGIGLLEIPPRLGIGIVDRLLGGSAQSNEEAREFSEIELALLDQIAELMLVEWCNIWSELQVLKPVLLGHEDNGRFLQTAPHDTTLIVLVLETKMGDSTGQMQLAIPCQTLEGFVRKLSAPLDPPVTESKPATPNYRWNRNLEDISVSVTAGWNDLQLTARDVVNLKPGDVLPLDAESLQNVQICLAGVPKFEGRLGASNGRRAIAVTRVLRNAPEP
jgi:flagellar motor switch protein FliM